jgi:hypothetical protein
MTEPLAALILGLGVMTLSIMGALVLFMLTGWDEEMRR